MRPHIEFIPSQWLPWDDTILAEARAGTAARVLSRDDLDGACSLIVRYPAGYRRGPETLDADEEFIVLEGGLEIDGVAYGRQGPSQRLVRRTHGQLLNVRIDDVFQNGMHEFLSGFIDDNNALGQAITDQYLS